MNPIWLLWIYAAGMILVIMFGASPGVWEVAAKEKPNQLGAIKVALVLTVFFWPLVVLLFIGVAIYRKLFGKKD